MDVDLDRPLTRLTVEYLTISGARIPDDMSAYFELYRRAFLEALAATGIDSDQGLRHVLLNVIDHENVGDFLADPAAQTQELAAFGLILFDRLVRGFGSSDPGTTFMQHEQLFECFEYARDKAKLTERARTDARQRWARNAEAKKMVQAAWTQHRTAYADNKSEFARTYSRLVLKEFGVSVSERQIREEWLKGIR